MSPTYACVCVCVYIPIPFRFLDILVLVFKEVYGLLLLNIQDMWLVSTVMGVLSIMFTNLWKMQFGRKPGGSFDIIVDN